MPVSEVTLHFHLARSDIHASDPHQRFSGPETLGTAFTRLLIRRSCNIQLRTNLTFKEFMGSIFE